MSGGVRQRQAGIATADGAMPTWIFHPEGPGPHPALIFYMDAPGMREELRAMCRRLAAAGYYVMLPDLYYRGHSGDMGPFRGDEDAAHKQLIGRLMNSIGIAFLRRARQILYDLEDADESARGIDSLRGVLRVALPSVLCIKILIPGLPLFLKDHPQLKIEFLTSDNMQDLVADGVDLAIRFGKMSDSGFGARKLASLERMLVASPAYLAARGAPAVPADLAQHDLIVGPLVAANWPWSFERDGKTETLKVEPRFLLNSAEAAIAGARHGLGLARAATLMCRDELASGKLVPALPGYKLEPVDLHAVFPAGRTPSQKVRLFTAFVSQLL